MNEDKITIWEERIHACQNSDLTVAAWCREHQISVATYYYWRKRVSANDEMLSVKEPLITSVICLDDESEAYLQPDKIQPAIEVIEKDIDLFNYLYEEVFGYDNLSFDLKLKKLMDDISNNFDIRYRNVYNIIRLSYSKK